MSNFSFENVRENISVNISEVEKIIGYSFKNKSLLVQAFTRRSYGVESGDHTDNEVLEFVGDRAVDYVLIRCMMDQYSEIDPVLQCSMKEGSLNRQMIRFKEGDYLASRLFDTGLSKFILCGKGDEITFKAAGDVMEALIAAVAVDCDWEYAVLDEVVERLLDIQLEEIEADYYTILNKWHHRHFGEEPVYNVEQDENKRFVASVMIQVPDSDMMYKITGDPELTRSRARSSAAQDAYQYLNEQGIWKNLKDSLIQPTLENAINQLQELYQKGYVSEPVYETVKDGRDWETACKVGNKAVSQISRTKIFSKKKAAYRQLLDILEAEGLCEEYWNLCLIGPLGDELLKFYKEESKNDETIEPEKKYDFILKKMNTYDRFLAGQDSDVHRVGEYHMALQKELCRQMEVPEDAFVAWKRKPLSGIGENCSE